MDIKLGNLKVSLAIIITIVVQAAGLIWYVSSLDSQMKTNATQIEELKRKRIKNKFVAYSLHFSKRKFYL